LPLPRLSHARRAFGCCTFALEHGVEPEYVRQLIRAQHLPPGDSAVDAEAWPWEVRVKVLGGFAVIRNGERWQAGRKPRKKPLELLRLLVEHGPRGVGQDLLAETLWPEAEGDAAHRALKSAVHRLRRLLGRGEAIVHQDGRLSLDPRLVFVDAWALEPLLTRIEGKQGRGAADTAGMHELRQKVGVLYRGAQFRGSGSWVGRVSGWSSGRATPQTCGALPPGFVIQRTPRRSAGKERVSLSLSGQQSASGHLHDALGTGLTSRGTAAQKATAPAMPVLPRTSPDHRRAWRPGCRRCKKWRPRPALRPPWRL